MKVTRCGLRRAVARIVALGAFACFADVSLDDIFETLWANEDVVGFSVWQFADTTTHQRNCGGKSGRIFGRFFSQR